MLGKETIPVVRMLSLFAYLDQFPFAVLPIDLLLCNTGNTWVLDIIETCF